MTSSELTVIVAQIGKALETATELIAAMHERTMELQQRVETLERAEQLRIASEMGILPPSARELLSPTQSFADRLHAALEKQRPKVTAPIMAPAKSGKR